MPKFVKATFYAESFLHSVDERLSTQRFTSNKSQRGQSTRRITKEEEKKSTRQIEGSHQNNAQSCFAEQRQKQDKVLSKSSNFDRTQAKNTSTKIKNLHLKEECNITRGCSIESDIVIREGNVNI